jgi:Transposase DDE domain group 1
MLTVRDTIPRSHRLATAEFTTLRMRPLKIAGRISETATRVSIAFAAACPQAALFRHIALSLQSAGP